MDRRLRELYRTALSDMDAIPSFLSAVKRSGYVADNDALYQYLSWKALEQPPNIFSQATEDCHIPADGRLEAIVRLLDFLNEVGTPAQCSNYSTYPRPYEGDLPTDSVDFFVFLRTRIGWDVVRPSWDEPIVHYSAINPEFLGWCRVEVLGTNSYRLSASNQVLERDLDDETSQNIEDSHNTLWGDMSVEVMETYVGRDMDFGELEEHLTNERPLNMIEYVEYFAPQLERVMNVDFDHTSISYNTLEACFPATFPSTVTEESLQGLLEQRDALLPPLEDYEFLFCIRRTPDTDRVSIRPADPSWRAIINPEGSFLQFRDVVAATRVEWMWEQFGQDLTWNNIFQTFMHSMSQEFEQNVLFCGHLSLEDVACPECGENVCPECFEREACHA